MNGGHQAVVGMTQSGKSWWVKHKLLPSCERVLVLDVNSEYSQHSRTPGPLRDQGTTAKLALHPRKLLEPSLSLAVEPLRPMPKHEAALLKLITTLLIAMSTDERARGLPQLTLVLDEIGDYAPQCHEELVSLATRGATHLNTRLIVVTQRPNLIPATVRSNISELECFKLVEEIDLDPLAKRTSKVFAGRVSRLQPRNHLTWRATGSTETHDPPAPPAKVEKELVA